MPKMNAILPLVCLLFLPFASALPMIMAVAPRQMECLYDKIGENEDVTTSIFVQSEPLAATALFEGPVAPPSATTGVELQRSLEQYGRNRHAFANIKKRGAIYVKEEVDFGDMVGLPYDDDDDYVANDAAERRAAQRRARRKARGVGEPIQRTRKVHSPGWYRFCASASKHPVVVQLELRKSSSFGPIDGKTGHVPTHEELAAAELETELELLRNEAEKAGEGAAVEEAAKKASDLLLTLARLSNDIRSKQAEERNRIAVHATTNEHSYTRMRRSALVETALYVLITAYQVYTVHKWLAGNTLLGR